MPFTEEHGGGCCGITHIRGFGVPYGLTKPAADEVRSLERIINRASPAQHLYEVALTDVQMTRWGPTLKRLGFKRTTRFLNSNSGNYVNVLHYAKGQPRGRARKAPTYTW